MEKDTSAHPSDGLYHVSYVEIAWQLFVLHRKEQQA